MAVYSYYYDLLLHADMAGRVFGYRCDKVRGRGISSVISLQCQVLLAALRLYAATTVVAYIWRAQYHYYTATTI